MKSHSYMNRAMRSRDPRFARVLDKLGYGAASPRQSSPPASVPTFSDLDQARKEYRELYGKRPYMGWDIDTIRERIATYGRRDMRAED